MNKNSYIYIISENCTFENNQTWIIDVFANEFMRYSGLNFTQKIEDANIVWIIGYNLQEIEKLCKLGKKPYIIVTIHHIDWHNNNNETIKMIEKLNAIVDSYHVICDKVKLDMAKLTKKNIVQANFWIDENNFYKIQEKEELRKKWMLDNNKYIVGSFQRDTMGKNKCMLPKLSKGPDILLKVLQSMKKEKPNLTVLLTGRRRNYIINELQRANINYVYHEMVNVSELNELYNCLDLYIVSSRVEGGPRAIMECGLAKTPIISTDVGIASLIMNPESIYHMDNAESYKNTKVDVDYVYERTKRYSISNYMKEFIQKVFMF
jgi:glycosyltransferase involved in cell wall biosynthesis